MKILICRKPAVIDKYNMLANNVILKIAYADGFEVERITNKTPEEVQEIMAALAKLEEKGIKSVHRCLENYDADYIPIIVSGGRNDGYPQFNDFEIDLNKKEVSMKHHLSAMQQAEQLINRMEFSGTIFDIEEKSLIMNHAYKLDNMADTVSLVRAIAGQKNDISLLMETMDLAQAKIDEFPDGMIGLSEMHEYGYTWEEMLPLTKETAVELFERDLPVYQLHEDGSETLIEGEEQITEYEGIFGIERGDWENKRAFRSMQEELAEGAPEKEAQLLYGDTDKYGIYQLKESPELRDFHFAGTAELLRRNLLSDDFKEIQPGNYNLIYTGELSDIQGQTQSQRLNALFEKFNIDHPADYKGHSLSVSDIVVLHKLPDMEIDGKMGEEMEARVWEIRMPDLTPAEQLAVEFDRFVYDYDRNQYHDSIQSMTENVADGTEAIEKGDTGYMTAWLADVAVEGMEPEETKKAAELLEKLSEYKPLAKIEELEENNYNMIDNVLNNGAGEKAQKEENKREQERPAARTSLKTRLAERQDIDSVRKNEQIQQDDLTRYEQEVVINFNADENVATVYSANPAWIRKMDSLVCEFPDVFRIKRQTEISKTYEIPKKYIRIGRPRELSFAQRENLEKMRDAKIKV